MQKHFDTIEMTELEQDQFIFSMAVKETIKTATPEARKALATALHAHFKKHPKDFGRGKSTQSPDFLMCLFAAIDIACGADPQPKARPNLVLIGGTDFPKASNKRSANNSPRHHPRPFPDARYR